MDRIPRLDRPLDADPRRPIPASRLSRRSLLAAGAVVGSAAALRGPRAWARQEATPTARPAVPGAAGGGVAQVAAVGLDEIAGSGQPAPAGLELVAAIDGPLLVGVAVSAGGRIFLNFPRWGDPVESTVVELRDGQVVPYPGATVNRFDPRRPGETFVSVQALWIDAQDRLWILDTSSPMFETTQYGGPKLLCVDLTTDQVVQTILFPQDVALPTTYLNDVRFDLRRGDGGMAFITDSAQKGPNGIIVVDLASGESWRRLHDHPSTKVEPLEDFLPIVEGRPFLEGQPNGSAKSGPGMGSDGIAIGADGARLSYCPLGSRRQWSVAIDALCDRSLDESAVAATVVDEGDRCGASDRLESDAAGHIYSTNYEHNATLRRRPDGQWETVVHDPRLLWPDTLSMAADGYLYVTANQLHRQPRYHLGRDLRRKPYALFRVRVDAQPVLLR